MPFRPGESGNKAGKPKGCLARKTQLSKLLLPHADEIISRVIQLAKEGDAVALKLVIERLIPKAKNEAIEFELPEGSLSNNETLLKLGEKVIQAVAAGEITLEESQRLTSLIEAQGKTIYLANLENRIIEMENLLKQKQNTDKEMT